MKKLGIGIAILVVIIASVIYYLNDVEEKQIEALNALQEKVTIQLTQMQKNGFNITDRAMEKEKEHFFITIVEPNKASTYLTQKGLRVTPEEAEELKDLKLSVELLYLSDIFSLDIYPVALPPYIKSTITKEDDTKILAQLEEMLKRKVFFMHVDIDHAGTTFKGHMKDIDETLQGEKEVKMILEGLQFSGSIQEEKIAAFKQTLATVSLYMSDETDISISDLESSYLHVGPTTYDYTSEYSIGKIESSQAPDGTLIANNLSFFSTSTVTNGLATEKLKANAENMDAVYGKEKIGMNTLDLDMNISNLDVEALEKLQNIDPNKEKEVHALIETLVSKNIHLDIANFSADKVILRGKEMGGFSLQANLDIDKSLDIYRLNIHPKHVLNKMFGTIDISLSKELLNLMKEDPKAMMIYMMYRPKRNLGQRLYHIKIGKGEVKINGKAVDF